MTPTSATLRILSFGSLLIFVSSGWVTTQAQPDSLPVLKGSASYTMPQSAIDAEIDGAVVVGVSVDEQGKPSRVWIAAGPRWPCGKSPGKALDELSETLIETLKKVTFTPALKKGKQTGADIGMTMELKNPKLQPPPVEIDPVTGKVKAQMISGGVMNGKALSLPKPEYPTAAKRNRDGGSVSVQVVIDERGNVLRAGTLNGAATLQYASRDAACNAQFSRTLLLGKPVKVSGIITYNFVP